MAQQAPKQHNVWVLGNGQLGAMLSHAGQPLAINVRPVDIMTPSDERCHYCRT